MLLAPVLLAVSIFLLVVVVWLNPWNLVVIVGIVRLCWPRRKRP